MGGGEIEFLRAQFAVGFEHAVEGLGGQPGTGQPVEGGDELFQPVGVNGHAGGHRMAPITVQDAGVALV